MRTIYVHPGYKAKLGRKLVVSVWWYVIGNKKKTHKECGVWILSANEMFS